MTDVNEIEAGSYVLVAEEWDEYTSKPGEPFDFVRHRKGAEVVLDVEQARRLVLAGAVVKPGSPAADLAQGKGAPDTVPATPATPVVVEVPVKSASKSDWVAYAVSQGMSEDDANATTRDALADQYTA